MAESKKNIQEFKSFGELIHTEIQKLPKVFLYVSTDSFEFDLISDHYKKVFRSLNVALEITVYVSEPGDLERFFSDVFNSSMFFSWKLIIIKNGYDLFKPLLQVGKKDFFENFKRQYGSINEKTYILIHYNYKDLPAKLSQMLHDNFGLLKSRNFYNEERKKALDEVMKMEKVTMEATALDEFMHRVIPNTGSYIRNVQKLKILLHKKHFDANDILEILHPTHEFNPFHFTDSLFSRNKEEVFREYSKLQKDPESHSSNMLGLFSILLGRLDEIRKAKVLFNRLIHNDDKEFFQLMNMSQYSDGRKKFVKSRLKREAQHFGDTAIDFFYDSLLELNEKMKSSAVKDQDILFQMKIQKLFSYLA
jgi:DNA polymerase III subunit delta